MRCELATYAARPSRARVALMYHFVPTQALTPAVLDAMAGIELQHGHHVRAEYLANRAAEMREVGR